MTSDIVTVLTCGGPILDIAVKPRGKKQSANMGCRYGRRVIQINDQKKLDKEKENSYKGLFRKHILTMRDKTLPESLVTALDILDLSLIEGTMRSVLHTSHSLGMPRSTTYAYLAVFREHDFVDCGEQSERHRLGMRVFEFGSSVRPQIERNTIAVPYFRELPKQD